MKRTGLAPRAEGLVRAGTGGVEAPSHSSCGLRACSDRVAALPRATGAARQSQRLRPSRRDRGRARAHARLGRLSSVRFHHGRDRRSPEKPRPGRDPSLPHPRCASTRRERSSLVCEAALPSARDLGDDHRAAVAVRRAAASVSSYRQPCQRLPAWVRAVPACDADAEAGPSSAERRSLLARRDAALRRRRRANREPESGTLHVASRVRDHIHRSRLSEVAVPCALPPGGRTAAWLLDGMATSHPRQAAIRGRMAG